MSHPHCCPLFDRRSNTLSGEENKLWSSALCNFLNFPVLPPSSVRPHIIVLFLRHPPYTFFLSAQKLSFTSMYNKAWDCISVTKFSIYMLYSLVCTLQVCPELGRWKNSRPRPIKFTCFLRYLWNQLTDKLISHETKRTRSQRSDHKS
jgi:hypothetical protein